MVLIFKFHYKTVSLLIYYSLQHKIGSAQHKFSMLYVDVDMIETTYMYMAV